MHALGETSPRCSFGPTVYIARIVRFTTLFLFVSAMEFMFVPCTKAGEVPHFLWARNVVGGDYEYASDIALAGTTNYFLTGRFFGNPDFGTGPVPNAGNTEMFLAKYTMAGALVWVNLGSGPGTERGKRVVVNGSGDSYVVGSYGAPLSTNGYGVTFGTATLPTNGGFLVKYNGAGQVQWARRLGDAAYAIALDTNGNCFVTGEFSGTQPFGSFILTNNGLNAFLAKYDSDGNAVWAQRLGGGNNDHGFGIAVDLAGDCYVTGSFTGTGTFGSTNLTSAGSRDIYIARFDNNGVLRWAQRAGDTKNDIGETISVDSAGNYYVSGEFRASITIGTNVLTGPGSSASYFLAKFDANNQVKWLQGGITSSNDVLVGRIAANASGCSLEAEFLGTGTVGPNNLSGHFIANYDVDGNLTWVKPVPVCCSSLGSGDGTDDRWGIVLDSQGNIFLGGYTTSGPYDGITLPYYGACDILALRLGPVGWPEVRLNGQLTTQSPAIATNSTTVTLSSSFTNATILYSLDGSPPSISSQLYTGPFSLTNPAVVWALAYDANFSRSVTGDPIQVSLYPLYSLVVTTNGSGRVTVSPQSNVYLSNAIVTLTAAPIGNGWVFDHWSGDASGTNPSIQIAVTNNMSIQAVFTDMELFTLTAQAGGGGTVSLNPPGATYIVNSVVTATATPASGWSFLFWLGDASGTNASVPVAVTRNKFVQAVFGTTLGTAPAGNGSIILQPPGGIYPYGTRVRAYAQPQPGSYFAFWGNAASGTNSPFTITLTNAGPTISALFGTLNANQFALTVIPNGGGQVAISPYANQYANGANVTLTAVPDSGQSFLTWSGDASGSQNPLGVVMNQSRSITASFSARASLSLQPPLNGLYPEGMRLTLTGAYGISYQIQSSSDFTNWTVLQVVTNTFGVTQLTDFGASNLTNKLYRAALLP